MPRISIGPDLSKIVRFLLVGGLNTLVGYAVFSLAIYETNGNITLSLLANIGVGVFFNYLSYGVGVFRSLGKQQFIKFCAAYLLIFVINYVALTIGKHWKLNVYLIQFINIFYLAPLSYYIFNKYVYAK